MAAVDRVLSDQNGNFKWQFVLEMFMVTLYEMNNKVSYFGHIFVLFTRDAGATFGRMSKCLKS